MFHIEIDGWDANIRFSACHFIGGHEKCSRLHGHDYAVHFRAWGKINRQCILMDFIELKRALRDLVKPLDHKTIIPGRCKGITVQRGKRNLRVNAKDGRSYLFPSEDVVVLDIEEASAEKLSEYILERFLETRILPDNVSEVEIGVDEGRGQGTRIRKVLRR